MLTISLNICVHFNERTKRKRNERRYLWHFILCSYFFVDGRAYFSYFTASSVSYGRRYSISATLFSMWQKCAIDFVNCKHSENVFFSSSLMIASDWTYNKSDIIILNRIILCCEYIVAISNSVLFRSQMNGMRFHDALFQFQIIKWQ